MTFLPGQSVGFNQPTCSLDSPHDQKWSPGTASTMIDLARIISSRYIGTHSSLHRMMCRITLIRLVSHRCSVFTFWPSRLASHAFLAAAISLATCSFSWLMAFAN